MKLREQRRSQQFSSCVVVAFAKFACQGERRLAVSRSSRARHSQQLVRDTRHCADHDHRPLLETSTHDRGNALDGFGVTHGGAAKLHDDAAISH